MIAAALLFLALAGPGEITARLRAEPAQVEAGEPMLWILEVEHPAGAAVRLPEDDPVPDDSWVLLEPRRIVRTAAPASADGLATTRATWKVLSLEPGERALPALTVQVEADGVSRSIDVEPSTVAVRSALQEGENAPRPIRGFHAAPERTSGGRLGPWAGALALLLVLGLWIRRRRRRKPQVVAVPTPLERLAGLAQQVSEDPESGRNTIYALTRLLRETTDRFLGEDRAALADADWAALRAVDERLPLGARTTFAQILRDAERVKYALHAPTRFALEALLGDARNALAALQEARSPLEVAA